ncbi:hypothetical protein LSH36_819g02056 [Paralvinella palmiformis]|uniref:Uncharacterized protein n=1 Tax=Paralvinella palmiformis TaxID=53620 RepID=A0AAD9IZX7_9ANNE|nr:hypothetical protein LSH36_819g02056 [Paralvinella palmiformis]
MITFWIILVASTVESGLCGAELRKYGELVKPGGTWEQSGVVLLFYQINYAASLVKIRADFRNNYPLYIQAWTALGIVNGSRQCELNNQWHYRSNRIGVATVSLPENSQMEINPGQYIGIFIPADTKIPIQFEQVYPAYNLFGSEYILASTVIIPGVKVLFGRIGYINKFSIEFYILPDVPTSTMKSIDSTSNHVTTNEESTQTATDAVEQTVGGLAVWKYTCPIIDFLHNNFPYSIVAVLKVIKRFH